MLSGLRYLGVLCGAALLASCNGSQTPEPPHIILLVADDLGLDVAPCHSVDVRMPYLQSLCDRALVFDRAYTHPYCTASRASLMTGRHPFRHGADDVRAEARKLPLAEVTLAELIRDDSPHDYRTAGFGKWHLADDDNGSERNPNLQGFDHYAGNPRQHHTYKYFDYDWFENGELIGNIEVYKTSYIVDQVLDYFSSETDKTPRFAMVNFTSPHKPFHAPPKHLHSYGPLPPLTLTGTRSDQPGANEYRANRREPRLDPYYHAMLVALDTEIERLVTTLARAEDRPILFVFLGDNGSAAEVFDAIDTEAVRSKATLYDGGVRVPLMLWSSRPEDLSVRTARSERLIHLADLFPTLADVAGVEAEQIAQAQLALDGVSFAADLRRDAQDPSPARDFVFLERGNDETLPFAYGAADAHGLKVILRDPERATNYSDGRLVEIYDTAADPLEQRNLLTTPCDVPLERVQALMDFIVSKASQNEAHSDWFQAGLYRAQIERLNSVCEDFGN